MVRVVRLRVLGSRETTVLISSETQKFGSLLEAATQLASSPRGVSLLWPQCSALTELDWQVLMDSEEAWEKVDHTELIDDVAWEDARTEWAETTAARRRGLVLSKFDSFEAEIRKPDRRADTLGDIWSFVHDQQNLEAGIPNSLVDALVAAVGVDVDAIRVLWKLLENETARPRILSVARPALLNALRRHCTGESRFLATGCLVACTLLVVGETTSDDDDDRDASRLLLAAEFDAESRVETLRLALLGTWVILQRSARAQTDFLCAGGLARLAKVVDDASPSIKKYESVLALATACVELLGTSAAAAAASRAHLGAGAAVRACVAFAIRCLDDSADAALVDAAVSAASAAIGLRGGNEEDDGWKAECRRVQLYELILRLDGPALDRLLCAAARVAKDYLRSCDVGVVLRHLESRDRSAEARMACGHIVFEYVSHGDAAVLLEPANFTNFVTLLVDDSLPVEARASLAPALSRLSKMPGYRWSADHVGLVQALCRSVAISRETRTVPRGNFSHQSPATVVLWHAFLALLRGKIPRVDDSTFDAVAEVLRVAARDCRDELHAGLAHMSALLLWRLFSSFPARAASLASGKSLQDSFVEVLMRHGRDTDAHLRRPRLLVVDAIWRVLPSTTPALRIVLPLERIVGDDETPLGATAAWLLFRLAVESPKHLAALRHRRDASLVDILLLGLRPNVAPEATRAALFALERVSTRSDRDRAAVADAAAARLAYVVTKLPDHHLLDLALRVVLNVSTTLRAAPTLAEHLLDPLLKLANDLARPAARALAVSALSNLARNHECRAALYLRLLERENAKAYEPRRTHHHHHHHHRRRRQNLWLDLASRAGHDSRATPELLPPTQRWKNKEVPSDGAKHFQAAIRKSLHSLWHHHHHPEEEDDREPVTPAKPPRGRGKRAPPPRARVHKAAAKAVATTTATKGVLPFGPPRSPGGVAGVERRRGTSSSSSSPWTPRFEACVLSSDGMLRAIVAPGGGARNTFKIRCNTDDDDDTLTYSKRVAAEEETQFCLFKRVEGSKVGELVPTFVFHNKKGLAQTPSMKKKKNGEYHCFYATRVAHEILAPSKWPSSIIPDDEFDDEARRWDGAEEAPFFATVANQQQSWTTAEKESRRRRRRRSTPLQVVIPKVPSGWRPAKSLEEPPPVVLARRVEAPVALRDATALAEEEWTFQVSVWSSRAKESSNGFLAAPRIGRKMFVRDWNELEKRPRFANGLLSKLGGGKNGLSTETVRSIFVVALAPAYASVLFALDFFVAEATANHHLDAESFAAFCVAAGLCEKEAASRIFEQSQQAAAAFVAGGRDNLDDDVVDRAAVLEALVRVLDLKHGFASKVARAAAAAQETPDAAASMCDAALRGPLERLKRDHLDRISEATVDPDVWRKRRMYLASVDAAIRPFAKVLRALWMAIGKPSKRHTHLRVDEWLKFLDAAGLLHSELSRRDARLVYFRSKTVATAEDVPKRNRTMTYASFLEAVCRAADRVRVPSQSSLRAVNARGLADFYEKLALVNSRRPTADDEKSDDRALDLAQDAAPPDTPLAAKLDLVLPYMIHCLAAGSSDGRFKGGKVDLVDYLDPDQQRRWLHQITFPSIKRALVAHRPGILHNIAKPPRNDDDDDDDDEARRRGAKIVKD